MRGQVLPADLHIRTLVPFVHATAIKLGAVTHGGGSCL